MRLFEVQIPGPPVHVPDKPAYHRARNAFEIDLFNVAGGFSYRGHVNGWWRDPSTGEIDRETMSAYHVAVDDRTTDPEAFAALVLSHFPSVKAAYVAEIGTANILTREGVTAQHGFTVAHANKLRGQAIAEVRKGYTDGPHTVVEAVRRLLDNMEVPRSRKASAAWDAARKIVEDHDRSHVPPALSVVEGDWPD